MTTVKVPPTGKDLFVGVDIGGTKVAAGLVNADGEITAQVRVPMVSASAQDGLDTVLSAIEKALPRDSRTTSGIGICAPGPLDPRSGVILNPPNLPCWRNFPLADAVQKTYAVPVKVDNDANAAALAETRWGAARGCSNVFYATLGTGIGTGIVFDGKIFHGRTGAAGEGGHASIDYRGPTCVCGKPGCIELFASGTAIVKRVRAQITEGRKSLISEMTEGKMESVTGEVVAKALAAGDALASEIMTETSEMLSLWLSNMMDLFDPEIIVIGGGAATLYQPFFDAIRKRVVELSINPRSGEVPIAPARYGADSGIAGGAALCT
jgi:glucokinase